MNPYMIELILKEKREDMIKEGERQRLIAQYDAAQTKRQSKLAVVIGDILIHLGERLKARYASKLEQPAG